MRSSSQMALLFLALFAGAASAKQLRGGSRAMLAVKPNTVFPFCRCDEYSIRNSPYLLELVEKAPCEGGEQLTFKVVANHMPPKEDPYYCRQKLQENIHKIGFRTFAKCEDSAVDVYVDGVKRNGLWDHFKGGSLFKLTNLKLKNALGAEITFKVVGACNSFDEFFGGYVQYTMTESEKKQCCPSTRQLYNPPSPPSPYAPNTPAEPPAPYAPKTPDAPTVFPPTPFPYCKCNRAKTYGGYTLQRVSEYTKDGMTTWSFKIVTQPGTNWALYKIEFPLKATARGAINGITVGNAPRSRTESTVRITNRAGQVENKYVFKITPLQLSPEEAHGKIITFSAKAASYKTLADLFETPAYSVFSDKSSKAYCPTYNNLYAAF